MKKSISVWMAMILLGFLFHGWSDQVVVLYALNQDLEAFRQACPGEPIPFAVGERKAQIFKLNGHEIYALRMGKGIAESAVSAEALLARFKFDYFFSVGPAGALGSDLNPKDWVQVTSVSTYQSGKFGDSGFEFSPDAVLNWSVSTHGLALPFAWTNLPAVRSASGDAFIASEGKRRELGSKTGAQIVEMNLAGILAACKNHEVKHVHFRVISDRADEQAAEDFKRFVETYDGQGGKMIAEIVKKLPPNPKDPRSYPEIEKLFKEMRR